ncbi:alpha/beta hydrolase [Streptomyces chumphonensis]|uniref:Alpha/beta fold hydrolase n=1 Tax=Streptomyces chumphonensis TaxID=1214925 RepID=A0A927EZ35_9ACTN|nr:alpha/beta hydrolase [Streptomyces chumphonensis]MBD3932108.1 alpha/beta fold hydrolase [Streptomyces chumphonensis]
METRRLLRTSGTLTAAAALLLSACTAQDGSAPPNPAGGNVDRGVDRVLEPLSAEIPGSLRPYYDQELDWRDCGPEGFQCADLTVPLDYEAPDAADDIEVAVVRARATDDGEPTGSLLVNPGGPGGSAVDFVQNFAGVGLPADVRAAYDIVGMDPRGVSRSEPVECLTDEEMDAHTQTDVTPDDAAETAALKEANDAFAAGCADDAGELLGHVSTVEAARDLDVLREVLGDEKLTYLGYSYGTFLGATYAGLFPSRSGRLVLDGAMDPSLPAEKLNRDQTAGFDTAFTAFAEDCAEQSDCPLGDDPEAAGATLASLLADIDEKPLPTGGDRELTESLATTGVISAMYTEQYWPRLRQALTDARDGDGAGLLALSDSYYERAPDGSYGNLMYANAAVNCIDQPAAFDGAEAAEAAVPDFEKASPVFGRNFAYSALICTDWPVEPTGRAHRIEAEGADPILVVGTTRDPATPYVWAEGLAAQLDSATLLTFDGDGHTAYGRGDTCVDGTVNSYLLEGTVPDDGKRC